MRAFPQLASGAAAAAALAGIFGCASAPASPRGPACASLRPPALVTKAPLNLPPAFTLARFTGTVVDEVILASDGAVKDVRLAWTGYPGLAPFAQKSILDSRFAPAAIEGNPVGARVLVTTRLGQGTGPSGDAYDSVWAHVADDQTREAQWQLAQSLDALAVSAHLGSKPQAGGEIAAVAPDGTQLSLVKLPPSDKPIEVRQTVKTGKFFWKAGDYRLELRGGGRALVWTTLTIADDHTRAIVNVCQPI